MDSTPVDHPPKKGMHGALKFFLMTFTGFLSALIATPCLLGIMTSETKTWTLKEQYALAINFFIITSVLFLVLTGMVGFFKRWGVAGFLFGLSSAMGSAILIAEFMKMFDAPK